MGSRRKARECVLQMLFQVDMGQQTPAEVRRTFWEQRSALDADVRSFTEDIFRAAKERGPEIDSHIERHAEHWSMERMSAVDRNILRSAVAEMMAFPQTPP